ncbi:L-fucose mutarotase [Ruegeria sp. THAF57]|uniref:L-rhamnose mutarotase n=1 Tax=Ruegeria sp. THAF57 TaxID=2744555 RepID=UPI0015DF5011|nr:L-rhamnose mutarotase [Ruegeria sp. THAF57]CAD0186934.1 L-fucose mutarotase [Ruegeria sp. THAF57]
MQRMGMVIGVKPEILGEYKRPHAVVWPDVLAQIAENNICNYTIFLREPENLLFGYREYHGTDFEGDTARMAQDPRTQEWWTFTNPCQNPLPSRAEGEKWAPMIEVFHTD